MKLKELLKRIGPGFITGAADDDPSGIATYSQTGARFGYGQLWTALFSFPFMAAVQEMCGRIGTVTGNGLSGVIRTHYPRVILYFAVFLLLAANTINIGADLGAMAAAAQLVVGMPIIFWLFALTGITLALEMFVPYTTYAKYLKYLTFSLFAYVIAAFMVKQDWKLIVWSTIVPQLSLSKDSLFNFVAVLGTTISPYLFFWQASEEVEEEIADHQISSMGGRRPTVTQKQLRSMRMDTVLGMLFSNCIMFFIIITTAATLGAHGITQINTATEAAEALRPLAGSFTFLLFALGILGTGMLAIPILAGSASYAIAEASGIKEGLYRKPKDARGFYGIIALATLVGLLINFLGIPPFKMLYYTAVFNGLTAPPLLVLILLIANNKKIMGKNVNGTLSNVLGVMIVVFMTAAGFSLFFL